MSSSLTSHPSFSGVPGPVLVVVMDGVGIGRRDEGDAVAIARTPTLDRLAQGPKTSLFAHGTHVGMPSDGDMGNSEVGHNALGAGRVFDQGAKLVEEAIGTGSLYDGAVWKEVVAPCANAGALHFIGLLSDGNVHSHQDHLHAMLLRAAQDGAKRLFVHALLDGRDVDERSALVYLERLEEVLTGLRARGIQAEVASGGGRMVTTMDRYEADWNIVRRGWEAHVLGEARPFATAREAVQTFRDESGVVDQFMPSFTVCRDGKPVGPIEDGDGVIFFNFRGDRAQEISRAFTEAEFAAFDRGRVPEVRFAGMMEYDGDLHIPPRYLVTPPAIDDTMGEYLARTGVTQWACSETQKYGHVTYFWNGNRSGRFDDSLEEYLEIPSDLVPFEERPWMKAAEISDAILSVLRRPAPPRFLRVNYANGDMVGHTGSLDATVLAVEALDLSLARVLPVLSRLGGAALITADHGNADQMLQIDKKTGAYKSTPLTSHTVNKVPLYLAEPTGRLGLRNDIADAGLANVAATALELLGWKAPGPYRRSLISSS
ncbi:MAG: 2,3-bisphosphoglycerate-independent phosphoglycerate mutase [Deltaproteobacteria bacterium]|nr:2,3-bisphosphoglycerate-independent phosphoglycerate mutase [Deltaproteobacteria bacterium]